MLQSFRRKARFFAVQKGLHILILSVFFTHKWCQELRLISVVQQSDLLEKPQNILLVEDLTVPSNRIVWPTAPHHQDSLSVAILVLVANLDARFDRAKRLIGPLLDLLRLSFILFITHEPDQEQYVIPILFRIMRF